MQMWITVSLRLSTDETLILIDGTGISAHGVHGLAIEPLHLDATLPGPEDGEPLGLIAAADHVHRRMPAAHPARLAPRLVSASRVKVSDPVTHVRRRPL